MRDPASNAAIASVESACGCAGPHPSLSPLEGQGTHFSERSAKSRAPQAVGVAEGVLKLPHEELHGERIESRDGQHVRHDPASCNRADCQRYDDYHRGYVHGKLKLESELLARLDDAPHSEMCGCRPCVLVRAVRDRLGLADAVLWVGRADAG